VNPHAPEQLWTLLRAQEGMEVLAVLETDVETIKSVDVEPVPDVAVMHFPLMTPGRLDAVSAVRRRWSAARVITLTCRLHERVVSTASESGVDGCIAETDSHTELLYAIRTVATGERYLPRSTAYESFGGPEQLTDREKEVMRLISAGYRTREIAHRLSLSSKTIEKHRASIMRKLGLRSAAAVAAYAIAHAHLIY
jgi:two-component system, NarL family, response regulator NreC